MPTYVLSTPTPSGNPGGAVWQDSTALPVSGGPALITTVTVSVPPLAAGDAITNGIATPGFAFGDPFILSWNYVGPGPLPVYLKVSGNINAPDNMQILVEAPVLQATPAIDILVRVYGF